MDLDFSMKALGVPNSLWAALNKRLASISSGKKYSMDDLQTFLEPMFSSFTSGLVEFRSILNDLLKLVTRRPVIPIWS